MKWCFVVFLVFNSVGLVFALATDKWVSAGLFSLSLLVSSAYLLFGEEA